LSNALLLALGLAGCTAPPPASTFRQVETPIWSAAAFAPAQIAGSWVQVADFTRAGGCPAGHMEFAPTAGGLSLTGTLCLNGREVGVSGLARPVGPGRLQLKGQEDWWVLWIDSGYRTLAIGTPSGRFGFVLDRGSIPGDRLTAAREVFDFNGYDAAALRPF
jgi:apolipoprotein D and lipocalin family protein